MADITFNGMTMEFAVVASMMNADIKAMVLETLGQVSEQEFLDAYMQAHRDKFGSEFLQV